MSLCFIAPPCAAAAAAARRGLLHALGGSAPDKATLMRALPGSSRGEDTPPILGLLPAPRARSVPPQTAIWHQVVGMVWAWLLMLV